MVSIIIINYNTSGLTCNCIRSVIENTRDMPYEIIVVDNASSDNSVQEIKMLFPEVIIISSDKNIGFGRANNLAVVQAKGDLLFFLNSDTLIIEDSVKKLAGFFKENEKELNIGALGCVLVDKDGNFNGAGGAFPDPKTEGNSLLRSIPGLGKLIPKQKKLVLPLQKIFFEIDYIIGADLMMKTHVFRELGGFDPAFFMYYEESDLQKRLLLDLQLKSYIYTGTKIIHLEDGSGKNRNYSNKKRIIVHTSRNIYLKKHEQNRLKSYMIKEKFFCFFTRFNFKYTIKENLEYIRAIRKCYL